MKEKEKQITLISKLYHHSVSGKKVNLRQNHSHIINQQSNKTMKKVVLMAIAAFALVMASCNGNKTKTVAGGADSDSVAAVDTMAPEAQAAADSLTSVLTNGLQAKDAKAVTTTLATLQTKYAELAKAGKVEEAKAYALKIQEFINKHADEINNVATGNTTIASLVEGIKNLPTSAETTAEEAVSAVKSDVQTIAGAAKSSAEATAKGAAEAAKTAENKANEAVSNAQNKANEAVNKANQKANDAINKANKKANEAVNNATNKALKGLGL